MVTDPGVEDTKEKCPPSSVARVKPHFSRPGSSYVLQTQQTPSVKSSKVLELWYCACLLVRTYVHTCTPTYVYTCTHTHTRTHARTHTHTHTRTHARTHARTHTCMYGVKYITIDACSSLENSCHKYYNIIHVLFDKNAKTNIAVE